ncbi:MAG: hypothetical protein WCF03_08490 [Nitrososphaeraceae archaeon]
MSPGNVERFANGSTNNNNKLSIELSIYKSGASHKEMEYVLFT